MADQLAPKADVARIFFVYTFGTISSSGDTMAPRVLSGFMAVSSLGNLIVMTYTAARGRAPFLAHGAAFILISWIVKQEIAKEGVFPFRKLGKFVARSYQMPDINIKKLFGGSSDPIKDETPIGALILHWSLTVLLILATGVQQDPVESYRILVSLYSYVVDAIFGVCLGGGLLFLRFYGGRKWYQKSKDGSGFRSWISIIAALLFTIANAFPVVASWIPPSRNFNPPTGGYIPWYTTPTVGWTVIACGGIYWLIFRFVIPHTGNHRGHRLRIQRTLFFRGDEEHPVQTLEQIKWDWITDTSSGSKAGRAEEQSRVEFNGHASPFL